MVRHNVKVHIVVVVSFENVLSYCENFILYGILQCFIYACILFYHIFSFWLQNQDPHFLTYDGTGYDYHGQCDLVMAHSDNIQDSGLPLDIHARTKIITDWSYISNVAIRVGTDIVEITSEGELYWNDISIKDNTEYPLRIADRFNLTRTEKQVFTNQYRIDYVINLEHHSEENGNDNIRVSSFKNMLSINVDTILSDTYGMLGITNKDGLYGRDLVTTIEDVNVMGDEWQVHDNEPMLFQNVTAPQFPERCVVPQTNSRHLLQSDELNSIAMDACADIQDKTMKSFCIQDVLITGDHEYAGLYHGN